MKNNKEEFYPVALAIGVSDSGGGSGVQADLRTFNAAGVFGCSVMTAISAQNPGAVKRMDVLDLDLVKAQLSAVIPALAVKAVKVGMLCNAALIRCVSDFFRKNKLPLIIDPAMFDNNGKKLLDDEALQALKSELLPQAAMIILSVPEAELLLAKKIASEKDCLEAAETLAEAYKCQILLEKCFRKNGKVTDIALLENKAFLLDTPALNDLEDTAYHGESCTFASGIAAMIATGSSWKDALRGARAHVYGALCETAHIGKGLDGMYPPLEDYSTQISLRTFNASGKGRGK